MSELIHNFGIDWKLLLAQMVNFALLLFILKKFAYKPILEMFKKRREDIAESLRKNKEADENFRQSLTAREEAAEKARQEALALISKAETEAKRRKEVLLQEANRKVEEVISDAKKTISREKAKMGEEFYAESEALVRLGIEKTIGKIPAAARDKDFIKEALQELKTLPH